MAEDGGDLVYSQHAVASRQFAKAGAIALLPAEDAADRFPVGQT